MTQLVQNVFNGLVASGIYLLIALGITIVFGLTRLINFAHGQLLVIGTFVAYTATSHGYPFWVALLASTVIVGVFSFLLERAVFRWTLASPLNGLIVGLGVLVVTEVLVVKLWGSDTVTVRPWFEGNWTIRGVTLSFNRLVAIALTVAFAGLMLLMLRRTAVGRHMEAAQANSLAAAHVGINVGQVISIAFVVGSAIAGSAGAVLGTLFPTDAFQGGNVIIKGFAVALLGGLGNVRGAIIASLIYGTGETLVAGYWDPTWVPAYTFGIIIAILLVRPGGLFGASADVPLAAQFGERRDASPRARWSLPLPMRVGLLAAAVALPVIIFNVLPTSRLQAVFVLAAIYAVVVYALSLTYHCAGMLSAAHGALMAVGAYSSALLSIHYGWGFWASLVPAFVISAVAGMIMGFPVARARGHYFLLLTFAFGALVIVLIQNLKSLTQGDQGLQITDSPGNIGPITFDGLTNQFYLAFGFTVAAAAVVWLIGRSPLGSRLAGIREHESLARSLGLNVSFYKVLAFGISGGIAGIGGVLYLYQQTVIVPDSFTVFASIQFIIMVVLGGRALLGPAVGVFVISLLPELLGLDPTNKQLAYGIVLCVVILLLPRGVVPSIGRVLSMVGTRWQRQPWTVAQAAATGSGIVDPADVPQIPHAGDTEPTTQPAAMSGTGATKDKLP
jgi:branched-chain amino acid transport system permease protein